MPIIDGKLYDYRFAKELYFQSSGTSREDPEYFNFGLYQKAEGDLFICGIGGGKSFFRYDCKTKRGITHNPGRVYLPIFGAFAGRLLQAIQEGKKLFFVQNESPDPVVVIDKGTALFVRFANSVPIYRERRRRK